MKTNKKHLQPKISHPPAQPIDDSLDPEKFWEDGIIANKPRFFVQSKAVINFDSGFGHKLLCDGLTFTPGHACTFSCKFCSVANMMRKNRNLNIVLKERGLAHEDIVVEIADAAQMARKALLRKGEPRFDVPDDNRVIYGSPLVDVAGTMEQVKVTVEICRAILELTHWHIRLLSKSTLLLKVAEALSEFRDRIIFGFSTGTLDNETSKTFEVGTALVSKRLEALDKLQIQGFRTFGMLCPILPQADYHAYAREVASQIDIGRCEHVWAEVLNTRGNSMRATIDALRTGHRLEEAHRLELVAGNKTAWNRYAEQTFLALAKVIPGKKLRFLQYVKAADFGVWEKHERKGAVLLGKYAAHMAQVSNHRE